MSRLAEHLIFIFGETELGNFLCSAHDRDVYALSVLKLYD